MVKELFLLTFLAGLGLISLDSPTLDSLYYKLQGFEEHIHDFGGRLFKKNTEEGTESHIHWPAEGLFSEIEHVKDAFTSFLKGKENPNKYSRHNPDILKCEPGVFPDYGKILGSKVAHLNANNTQVIASTPCYNYNLYELVFVDDTQVDLYITSKNATHKWHLCGDGYFMASTANYHIDVIYLPGKHKFSFKKLSPYQMKIIKESGLFVFRFCDSVRNILPDIIKSSLMFLTYIGKYANIKILNSDKVVSFQEERIREFFKRATGYEWKKRATNNFIMLNKSLIHSGDLFPQGSFDGIGALIQYGTGGHIDHMTMALWMDDGELYIVESDSSGIHKTKFETWMRASNALGSFTAWLPLKPEYAKKFNETAAQAWFKQLEGLPYGFENFLFGWVDTPHENLPPLLDPEIVAPVFSIIEHFAPDAVKLIFTSALNKRLGTEGLNVSELSVVIAQRNLTFPEVFAMVEQDGWLYDGKPKFVCSAFVTSMYKAAGLFDGIEVNAVEWTPRDLYLSEFIDPNPDLPAECIEADPTNPFCQISGEWRLEFEGVSTVPITPHMNERCPTIPPLYERPPGC